ncbi:homocysteine S-methyltransferase family protein [Rubinisphaera italica]|uniref:Homocysteine S-methyltransferase n=1 Tax=Rubinisphaera italica TaxID=2527969 RepID=A0A5C5XHM9_9PLAN|nr:homocysteine S-methyltransferase family protein [Rubinisphaera italica]TWT62597.1 Homocysteine S-methyltransferase [Rubinisphaera italica]
MPDSRVELMLDLEKPFLTDGGMETTLIFHEGIELPHFASITLMQTEQGREVLKNYFRSYLQLAKTYQTGFVLESVTWRASADWASPLGLTQSQLQRLNEQSVQLLEEMRAEFCDHPLPILLSGCIGPRGDGYQPGQMMTAQEAEKYHRGQTQQLVNGQADMISAMTLSYMEEGLGIARAAQSIEIPVVLSFTVETDGRLPSGELLSDVIRQVDEATGGYPLYYMINCAHPSHFLHLFEEQGEWMQRIQGLRTNASTKSHAELDESTELDIGDPHQLGRDHISLMSSLNNLKVLGGCCGTDLRHVDAIARNCL